MNPTAGSAQKMPSATKAGVCASENAPDCPSNTSGTAPNSGCCEPSTVWVVAALTTLATTMGVKVRSEKSRRITSSVKKMPAMGALNTDAMPAAAPHPSSVAMLAPLPPSHRAALLPMVAPMVTIGPSGPALPPEPIVKVLASQCRMPMRSGMLDPWRFTAYSTRDTPCPRKADGTSQNTAPVSNAPTTGAASTAA